MADLINRNTYGYVEMYDINGSYTLESGSAETDYTELRQYGKVVYGSFAFRGMSIAQGGYPLLAAKVATMNGVFKPNKTLSIPVYIVDSDSNGKDAFAIFDTDGCIYLSDSDIPSGKTITEVFGTFTYIA